MSTWKFLGLVGWKWPFPTYWFRNLSRSWTLSLQRSQKLILSNNSEINKSTCHTENVFASENKLTCFRSLLSLIFPEVLSKRNFLNHYRLHYLSQERMDSYTKRRGSILFHLNFRDDNRYSISNKRTNLSKLTQNFDLLIDRKDTISIFTKLQCLLRHALRLTVYLQFFWVWYFNLPGCQSFLSKSSMGFCFIYFYALVHLFKRSYKNTGLIRDRLQLSLVILSKFNTFMTEAVIM